jgi:hypothetical protein
MSSQKSTQQLYHTRMELFWGRPPLLATRHAKPFFRKALQAATWQRISLQAGGDAQKMP